MDNRRVIVPLDFPDAGAALALAARLDPPLCRVKVKFHDIPNTVAGACPAAAHLGPIRTSLMEEAQ